MKFDPKPGERVRIVKGEFSGRQGDLVKIAAHPYWNDGEYHVALDGCTRSFGLEYLGPATSPREVPLLEYLDKLEAKLRAPGGCPECGRQVYDETALALITKLREAVEIVRHATEIASMTTQKWVASPVPPSNVVNEFQDRVVAWASIEVPE